MMFINLTDNCKGSEFSASNSEEVKGSQKPLWYGKILCQEKGKDDINKKATTSAGGSFW